MPIKRLERDAQFPNIGQLRKGAVKSGNRPGSDLEYFRFVGVDKQAESLFAAAYGDQPNDIQVYLPFSTTDENFAAWQEEWVAGGLQHRCDGETCVNWYDASTGRYSQEPKPCPGGCKPQGRLMVIVPDLQRFAYVTVMTTAINDILSIRSSLLAVESMAGTLQGIPFILSRRPQMISTPGKDGKRVRREKWLISIEADPIWAAQRFAAMRIEAATPMAIAESTKPMLEVAPDYEDDEDDEGEELDAITIDAVPKLAIPAPTAEDQSEKTTREKEIDEMVAAWDGKTMKETKSYLVNGGYASDANEADELFAQAKIKALGNAESKITKDNARLVRFHLANLALLKLDESADFHR